VAPEALDEVLPCSCTPNGKNQSQNEFPGSVDVYEKRITGVKEHVDWVLIYHHDTLEQ
jgi:hypothetical protein